MELHDPVWERQGWETEKAFVAFLAYRDAGSDRSLKAVWAKESGLQKGAKKASVPGHIVRWCRVNRWQERAGAWDAHLQRLHDEALAAEFVAEGQRLGRRHAEDAMKGQTVFVLVANAIAARAAELVSVPVEATADGQEPPASVDMATLLRAFGVLAGVLPRLQNAERVARGDSLNVGDERASLEEALRAAATEAWDGEEAPAGVEDGEP